MCHEQTWWIDDSPGGSPRERAVAFVVSDFALLCGSPTHSLLLVLAVHSSLCMSQVVHGCFIVARLVGGNFRIVGRVPPGRCSRITPRLSDSGEAVPLVCKRSGGELAVPLQPIPPRLDCPKIRLVFIDVIGNGHCGHPIIGLVLNQHRPVAYFARKPFSLPRAVHPRRVSPAP